MARRFTIDQTFLEREKDRFNAGPSRRRREEGGRTKEEAQPTLPPLQRQFVFIRVNSWFVQTVMIDPPSAICIGRLSLHRLPPKHGCALCAMGIGSAPGLVVTTGEPSKIAYANGIRSFAACCSTHFFFEDRRRIRTIDVTIASLDDPTPFAPQKAIFLEDKLP